MVISIACIAIGILATSIIWVLSKQQEEKQPPAYNSQQITTPTASSSTPPIRVADNAAKTYRNEDWGFEFQYPESLVIKENVFTSYYSKFNFQVEYWNKEGKYLSVFDANVVLPEFANQTFLGVNATTSIVIVNGVKGIKYEYEFEGLPEVAIVLPMGQYKIILGIGGSAKFYNHQNDFDKILNSFKFLK